MCFVGLAFVALASDSLATVQERERLEDSLDQWRVSRGSSWRMIEDKETDRAQFLYGGRSDPDFAPQSDSEFVHLARLALLETRDLHGVDERSLVEDQVVFLPLGLSGSTDKYSVRFRQEVSGVPVESGYVNALFDASGGLLSIQQRAQPDFIDFDTEAQFAPSEAVKRAKREFRRLFNREATQVSDAELLIAQLSEGGKRTPVLGWKITAIDESLGDAVGREFLIDAKSGEVRRAAEAIHHFGQICVSVGANATPGLGPDTPANPPAFFSMPHTYVDTPLGVMTTDSTSTLEFAVTTEPANCHFEFSGPFCDVTNLNGARYSFDMALTSGVCWLATYNNTPDPLVTAQANAFVRINQIRDWIRSINPTDATADFLHVARVNDASSCNAYYNGSSTTYFLPGGACPNTAFSTVIDHESGHWLNVKYGTGNGSDGMGEGNADVFSMYHHNTNILGQDFFGSGQPVRDGLNLRQYWGDDNPPPGIGVHSLGEVWMGAAWKIRRNLQASFGDWTGGQISNQLFSGWMNAYDQQQIHSVIECQWLTLDDDDGIISNGTPHFTDINSGFMEHGFPGCPLSDMVLHYTFDDALYTGRDNSGNGHGGVTGNVGIEVSPCGRSVIFGADDNEQELWSPDSPELDMVGAMTGMAWIKPLGTQSPDGNTGCTQGTVMTKGGNYWFQVEHDNDGLGFQNEGSGTDYVSVATSIPVGAWTHVAFTRDADGKTVRFYKNGVPLNSGGSALSNLGFANSSTFDVGNYSPPYVGNCEFNGVIDEVRLFSKVLTQSEIAAICNEWVRPVRIVSQPQDWQGCIGATAQMSVSAEGDGPFSYQWFVGGAQLQNNGNFSGVTTATLTIQGLSLGHNGSYYCRVTNDCGPENSANATVSVIPGPTITSDPANVTTCVANTAQFSVTATAPPEEPNLSYLWEDGNGVIANGGRFSGASTATLTISGVTAAEAGQYRAVVQNTCGEGTSAWASLSVGDVPAIDIEPVANSTCSGSSVFFTLVAAGSATYPITGYQWYKDGASSGNALSNGPDYSGAMSDTLTVLAADAADAGIYMCRVTNGCGAIDSDFVGLTVNASNTGPISVMGTSPVCAGDSVMLSASGGSGGSVHWYVGSTAGSAVHTGDTYSFTAPATTTSYFARREGLPCSPSPAGSFDLVVRPTFGNTSCASAIAMGSSVQGFDNTCTPDGASTDCVRKGLWYSFVATSTGTGHAEITGAGHGSALAVYAGDCGFEVLEGCSAGGVVDFPMTQGATYRVKVGSSGSAGGAAVLEISDTPAPACPDELLPSRVASYTFTGLSSGNNWSWKIVSGDSTFQTLAQSSVAAPPANAPPADVCIAFADSINAAALAHGCTAAQIEAVANPFGLAPERMTISFHSNMASGGLQLWVGRENEEPNCMVVTSSQGAGCGFLVPLIDIVKDDVPEDDCNENAFPDFFDILVGISQDIDGDGVPDECAAGSTGLAYCFGDGSSIPCPCGNNSAVGAEKGCVNSAGSGADLRTLGAASLANDSLVLRSTGLPNSVALFFQGGTVNALPFGDGLRCVGGSIIRLGAVLSSQGVASYPPQGGLPISVRGQVTAPGVPRSYQVWYRDTAVFCTSSNFNLSSAVEILWQP